jgi:hypothetical protein
MSLTPEQKAQAIEFIESGDRLRAIGYLQEILHISAFQSQTLIDSLEQELTATDPNFQKRTNKRAGLGTDRSRHIFAYRTGVAGIYDTPLSEKPGFYEACCSADGNRYCV